MIKEADGFFKSLGTSVLVEGYPHRNSLSPENFARLRAAALPVSEKVKRIADAWDYKVDKVSGAYVFTKRYSHPDDLPAVTESEVKRVIENIDSSCRKYGLGTGPIEGMTRDIHAVLSFYKKLSDAQKDMFFNTGINFQNLDQDQRELIEKLLIGNYFSPILSGCFQARVVISENEISQVSVQGKQAICSFLRSGNRASRTIFPSYTVEKEFSQPVLPKWPEGFTKVTTLEKYIQASQRKIETDEILREKPLMVLGKEGDDAQFLAMLSVFCPYRTARTGDRVVISAKPIAPMLDLRQIAKSLLPETLRRYIFVPPIPDKAGALPRDRSGVFPLACGTVVENEIVEELGKRQVPFAELSAFQRRCVMLRLLSPIVAGLARRDGEVPTYVSQRHQTLIKGKMDSVQGRTWLTITFAVPEGALGVPRVRLTMSQIPVLP